VHQQYAFSNQYAAAHKQIANNRLIWQRPINHLGRSMSNEPTKMEKSTHHLRFSSNL